MLSLTHPQGHARARIGLGILLSSLLIVTSIGTVVTLARLGVQAAPNQVIPGQQVWRQGVSSLLFGANDANWKWSANNLGSNPQIAATAKQAGITVIRAALHSNDALARVSAIEAAGAKCLGILSEADAEQVVRMLGDRCTLYEWLNEPDNGGPSSTEYSNSWNMHIPTLRSINPNASFIGPVVAYPNTGYIQNFLQLTKAAGNLPDIVSYHMYVCTDQSIAACPAHLDSYQREAARVRATIAGVLGYTLPLALTEWNYSWKPDQTPNNDPYMRSFTTLSLEAMVQAGISIATQFDLASNAGNGSLDMIDPPTGRALPQLEAMSAVIQKYRQGYQPAPPTGRGQTPPVAGMPPVQLPTTTQVAQRPAAVNQPPPVVVVSGGMQGGLFVVGQQLHCEPGVPTAANITQQAVSNTVLSALGVSQDGCSLVFKMQSGDQTLRLNWWNSGPAVNNTLTFFTSSNSTNGEDGTWTPFPASALFAAGGTQLLTLQNSPWVKVRLNPPGAHEPAVNLTMELYTLSGSGSWGTEPIALPRH